MLIELSSIKNIPENSLFVTIDVLSPYINIHYNEGAEACFKNLEEKKKKSIPSIFIKKLILVILKSIACIFCNEYHRQIIGTALAPNYANYSSTNLSRAYCVIILKKLDYHLWYGLVLLTIFFSYVPLQGLVGAFYFLYKELQ